MLLQFCDKCGRPLSEGCLARGEAIERNGELICSSCIGKEQAAAALRGASETGQETTGPLGHYEQAVWSCDVCGIPVTALDLIEGRAARIGELLKCSRCERAAKPAEPAASPSPKPKPAPTRKPGPAPVRPIVPPARNSQAAAASYVEAAKSEQKRPVLPLVMFAIVLPMFAVSLYFAVTSQQKLNEVMTAQGNEPDRRDRRPREQLQPELPIPEVGSTSYEPPADAGEPALEPPPPQPSRPGKLPIPSEVLDDLVAVERQLAEPVIRKLQSPNPGELWEGLIEAGSGRLIATRPYVRVLLQDPDDRLRAIACRVTGMLDDKEALPRLNRMVEQDPSEAVRVEARKARDRMTGQATRELRDLTDAELEEMLRDIQRELDRRKGSRD